MSKALTKLFKDAVPQVQEIAPFKLNLSIIDRESFPKALGCSMNFNDSTYELGFVLPEGTVLPEQFILYLNRLVNTLIKTRHYALSDKKGPHD